MATASYTWSNWATPTFEALADGGATGSITYAKDATDVAAKFTCVTKNISLSENGQPGATSGTWASIFGIRTGDTVTDYQVTAYKKKLVANALMSSAGIKIFMLRPDQTNSVDVTGTRSVDAGIGTTIDGAYTAQTAGISKAVDTPYQAGSTNVSLILQCNIATTNGGGSANVDVRFDDVTVTITYTPAATNGPIASTDGADTNATATSVTTGAAGAATDGGDTAAVATTVTTGGTIAATDAGDTIALAASVTTGAAIGATDGSDVASTVAATWTTAQTASTDGGDISASATSVTTGAALSATDAPDTAAVVATISSATNASIASTDAADQGATVVATWTTAQLLATDAPDTTELIAAAGAIEQRYVPYPRHESHEYSGPQRRYRTEEEIRQRRIDLGIIPAPVEKIVAKAARRVIAKAQASARQAPDFDALGYLQSRHEQQRAILAADLRKRAIDASLEDQRTYMILLALEIEAQMLQQDEDEQILALLMEM